MFLPSYQENLPHHGHHFLRELTFFPNSAIQGEIGMLESKFELLNWDWNSNRYI